MTTFAPSATKSSTVALPMPPAPPVMMATLPASSCATSAPRPASACFEGNGQRFDGVRGNRRRVADLAFRDRQLDGLHLPDDLARGEFHFHRGQRQPAAAGRTAVERDVPAEIRAVDVELCRCGEHGFMDRARSI